MHGALAVNVVQLKALQILGLLAGLNLFLFLFNLLPILPLDGGHVAGALYEGARRKVARVRGRPDPVTGYVIDLGDLKDIMNRMTRMTHMTRMENLLLLWQRSQLTQSILMRPAGQSMAFS